MCERWLFNETLFVTIFLPSEQIESWMGCEAGDYGWSGGFKHHPVGTFGMKDDGIELN